MCEHSSFFFFFFTLGAWLWRTTNGEHLSLLGYEPFFYYKDEPRAPRNSGTDDWCGICSCMVSCVFNSKFFPTTQRRKKIPRKEFLNEDCLTSLQYHIRISHKKIVIIYPFLIPSLLSLHPLFSYKKIKLVFI